MKQFVGLVNYFHDHVHHHADIMKALHNTIFGYEKKTRAKALIWTEEGTLDFYQIIKEIEKNQLCFFLEMTALLPYKLIALSMG